MNEKYNYNLRGSDRKPLVEAISQILGKPAVYQWAPSFSYTVGSYTIGCDGTLSCGGDTDPGAVRALVEALRERGFAAEKVSADNVAGESAADGIPANRVMEALAEKTTAETAVNEAEPEEIAADENIPDAVQNGDVPNKLTIGIPDTGFTPKARENLKKIVASKETLLKQALGTDSLPIKESDGKIAFPWFTLHGLDGEADAYSRLITAICNMAKNQKRVTAVEKLEENSKYGMRLFLVRLGFIGDEYKTARKILLRNLTGNSSWKSGHKPEPDTDTATPPATPAEETENKIENQKEGGVPYDK